MRRKCLNFEHYCMHLRKGMIRLETLIELKSLNSSCSSLSSWRNQTNSSLSSNSRQQYLSQEYPRPLLHLDAQVSEQDGWARRAVSVNAWRAELQGLLSFPIEPSVG